MQLPRGVTLMELLVALAILGLLLLLSLPSYNRYVQRSYRTEAIEALLNEASRQERNYLVKRRFVDRSPYDTASGHYRISVELDDSSNGYLLRAQPLGSQANDTCGIFELDNRGRRHSQGESQKCWGGRG